MWRGRGNGRKTPRAPPKLGRRVKKGSRRQAELEAVEIAPPPPPSDDAAAATATAKAGEVLPDDPALEGIPLSLRTALMPFQVRTLRRASSV